MRSVKGKSITFFIILMLIFQNISFIMPVANAEETTQPAETYQVEVPEGYIGIYTPEDLDQVRNNLNGRYILMNNLDLTEATSEGGIFYRNGAGWEPIGTQNNPFKGIFDGNNYQIVGLKINIESDQTIYAGLFGYTWNASFENVGIVGSEIRAGNNSVYSSSSNVYAGGIVGYADKISIKNSYHTGSVKATSLMDSHAGGLVGYIDWESEPSLISNSYNTGTVDAMYAGGIAGKISRVTISEVYNKGNIQGEDAGGIIGFSNLNTTIVDSYNTGSINFKDNGGGIIGDAKSVKMNNIYNTGDLTSDQTWASGGGIAGSISSTTIENSYNNGNIKTTADYTDGGGIVGYASSNSTIVNSYNLGQVDSKISAGGIIGESISTITSKSYNSGTIKGRYAGGIIGWSYTGASTIDSFNTGTINGQYYAGGLVGYGSGSTIQTSYNTGDVSVVGWSRYGGIAGKNEGTTITNSYYYTNLYKGVGEGSDEGTTRLTFQEMQEQASFVGFDFSSTWTMAGDENYLLPEPIGVSVSSIAEEAIEIEIKEAPEKTTYIQYEDFDVTGGVLLVRTNFGREYEREMTPEMVSDFDKNAPGSQTVTITFEDEKAYQNITVLEKDVTPPSTPAVNEITNKSTVVSGQAEPGSSIKLTVNNETLATGLTDDNGTFEIEIPVQKAGKEIVVTATDEVGNTSNGKTLIVKDVIAPTKPVVDEITDKTTIVTGTAEAGSIVKMWVYNNEIGRATANSDGQFSMNIPLQQPDTPYLIESVDESGNVSETVQGTIKDITAPGAPEVKAVTDQIDWTSGQAEPLSIVKAYVNGVVIGSTQANNSGYYSISFPFQKAGTKISFTSTDNAGNTSLVTSIVVTDGLAPKVPTIIGEITNATKNVIGTAEAFSTVKVWVNNRVIGTTSANRNGSYTVTIPPQKGGVSLYVTSTDTAGNTSGSTSAWVKDVIAPVKPTVYAVSDKSTVISGKAELGTIIEVDVNTWIIASGHVGEDGNFRFTIPTQQAGTKLRVVSHDAYGNSSEAAIVYIKSSTLKGWAKLNGYWYFFDYKTGDVKTGWLSTGGEWYFMNNDGKMHTGWLHDGGTWYYMNGSGAMATGWLNTGGSWYYLHGSGGMATGWLNTGGSWYYLHGSGAMATGWLYTGSSWYYLYGSGAMATGWIQLGNSWYYLYNNGAMAKNTIIGGWKLGNNGAWIR